MTLEPADTRSVLAVLLEETGPRPEAAMGLIGRYPTRAWPRRLLGWWGHGAATFRGTGFAIIALFRLSVVAAVIGGYSSCGK